MVGGRASTSLAPAHWGGGRRLLESEGPLVGAVEGLDYAAEEVTVPAGSRLFVYSDGAFEIIRRDGTMWPFAEFVETLARESEPAAGCPAGENSPLDGLLGKIYGLSGREDFHDDFSMVELVFD